MKPNVKTYRRGIAAAITVLLSIGFIAILAVAVQESRADIQGQFTATDPVPMLTWSNVSAIPHQADSCSASVSDGDLQLDMSYEVGANELCTVSGTITASIDGYVIQDLILNDQFNYAFDTSFQCGEEITTSGFDVSFVINDGPTTADVYDLDPAAAVIAVPMAEYESTECPENN